MRIDYGENCGGYLKSYNGEDNEALFLADCTSLHLNIVSHTVGGRDSTSLYQLDGGVLNSTVNSSGSSHG
jgi:FdhE protein